MIIDEILKILKKSLWTVEDKNRISTYLVHLVAINESQHLQLMDALKTVSQQRNRIDFYRSIYLKIMS